MAEQNLLVGIFDDRINSKVEPVDEMESPSGLGGIFDDRINSKADSVAPTEDKFELGTETPEGVRDLTNDAVYAKIAPHMESRFGMTEAKHGRQEVVDAYVNYMRKFNFGQSVVTGSELAYLNGATDIEKAQAAAAYSTFDSMKGAFAEGTSGMEKLDAVYDYGRALIVDPLNLVGFGIGKLVTGGGTKAAAVLAKQAVRKEVTDIMVKKGITKGSLRAAQETERKLIGETLRSEAFKTASKKLAVKEAGVVGAVDTVAGVTFDAMYQESYQRVKLQDNYSLLQGGFAAAGGMFGTGLSMGLSMLSKGYRGYDDGIDLLSAKYFDQAATDMAKARMIAGDVAKVVKDDLDLKGFQDSLPGFTDNIGSFADKVQRGSLVRLMSGGQRAPKETQIRKAFYLGDEESGIRGLAGILADNGVRNWSPRNDKDNFSNWLMDLVNELPQDVQDQVNVAFKKSLGSAVDSYKGKTLTQALAMDAQEFSLAGKDLNTLAQMSKTLKFIPPKPADEMLEELIDLEISPVSKRVREAFSSSSEAFQRNFIRMLVTHPGTTALNLIGWVNASTLQSTADMVRGTLYGGRAMVDAAMFNSESSAKYARKAGLMFSLQKDKMANLLDPHMTYEGAMDFLAYNPEAQKKLFRYMAGGVDVKDIAKELGFTDVAEVIKKAGVEGSDAFAKDPGAVEKIMNGMQVVYGVKATDMVSKTQELMYALDKRIRVKYNKSYVEFIQDPELWKRMNGEEYTQLVSEATDDALRVVFSKAYGTTDGSTLGYIAKAVEDARKLPILGALVPFGQFFNNTLAHIFDYTGMSIAHKAFAGTSRDPMELAVKTAVGYGAIAIMTSRELDNLDEGLSMFQERSSDGAIRDRKFDFPYSFYKAVGRLGAYIYRDGEIPAAAWKDFAATFGVQALTRQLDDTMKSTYALFEDIVTGEADASRAASGILTQTISMYASGYTRFADPVNLVTAMAKGENYVAADRKQGQEWVNNSVRYVDEILSAMELYTKPEAKQSALTDTKARVPIGRIWGVREDLAQSPIQEMYNQAGLPQWQTQIRSSIPEARNDVNRVITPFLNARASDLMDMGVWKKADSKERKQLITDLMSRTKKDVLKIYENSFDPRDTKTGLLFKLGGGSFIKKKDLATLLKDMDLPENPADLDVPTLQFLEAYIELEREQKRESKGYLDLK